jgi:maleylacetoacetate isomerase
LRLYDYPRSSAAYRTRIALNLKGLAYETQEVHLLQDGGQHLKPEYRAINPQARVPSLVLDDGTVLIQSPSILEFLDETHPEPPFLPADPTARARVRAVFDIVACDIHPLNNLAVLRRLKRVCGQDDAAIAAWYRHWITEGFDAIEQLIAPGPYCFGAAPGLADIALVPQCANAARYELALDPWPKIAAANEAASAHPAFVKARPQQDKT